MSDTEKRGFLKISSVGGELRVQISNLARMNAMSLEMWEHLASAVNAASVDNAMRIVVLEGDGNKAFAAGADISEFKTHRNSLEQAERFNVAVRAAMDALSHCRHPTVALIRGICFGGGLTLSISCDLRYCERKALFRMPAGRLGLGYDPHGIRRFVQTIGVARTADLFLTGRIFDGVEAERIGYVHEAFGDETFALLTAARIAAIKEMAPLTLRAAKLAWRGVQGGEGAPEPHAVDVAFKACFASQDYQEGQLAFLEKREPVFRGV